jgi:ATP-dependent helicase HrpB
VPRYTELPVEDVADEVIDALEGRGAAVLVAPPGSGKTTVMPLRLLDAQWLSGQKIVMLEPRRLATRAAARRMADLLSESVGETVGYVTRDDRQVSSATRIEVVTEGVLIRRLQNDPELAGTGLVIFDEVHERNLVTDLGLAMVTDVISGIRPDLRVLVMSATIEAGHIAAYLGGGGEPAPVVISDARSFPIDVRWMPKPKQVRRIDGHVASVVQRTLDSEPGDILVFLPGMGEIRGVEKILTDAGVYADVRPLHGSLPLADQDAAIAPSRGKPKVVLSTDIAETSLTVEGVRVVVDSGLARSPRFDPRTGMTRLKTIPISKASADQRAGRAGRTEPGVAIRLWSKLEHGGRARDIAPEITQVDLAGLAVELALWGVDGPADLRFLSPPPSRAYDEAIRLLTLLGAFDEHRRLTEAGRAMAGLPVHPRLARMIAGSGDDAALAVMLATLIDERDIFRGHPDDVPVDLATRVEVAIGTIRHPSADRRTVDRVERASKDLARRAGVRGGSVDPDRSGRVLALAFPDRLAIRRGSPGTFQLRSGTAAWIPERDPLAVEQFVVPADLDGKRKSSRIRLAAAIDADDVAELFAHEVDTRTELVWEGDRLVERTERRLGAVAMQAIDRHPEPSNEVTLAIAERVAAADLVDLRWTDGARSLIERVTHLHRALGDPWPDWSRPALAATVNEWLVPFLTNARGLDEARALDLTTVLRSRLDHRLVGQLGTLAPTKVRVPSGREIEVDYSGDIPTVSVRVQEMYGAKSGPLVGGEPVLLELLSPARRPVQITRDLGGFWTGSWEEVRKEMAGRYPKHDWPLDPATAKPATR